LNIYFHLQLVIQRRRKFCNPLQSPNPQFIARLARLVTSALRKIRQLQTDLLCAAHQNKNGVGRVANGQIGRLEKPVGRMVCRS
jgi:hypothetical protein